LSELSTIQTSLASLPVRTEQNFSPKALNLDWRGIAFSQSAKKHPLDSPIGRPISMRGDPQEGDADKKT
jgi:hypothetical protein